MPLIPCPACASPCSSEAPYCLKCGHPLKKDMEKVHGAINPKDPVHLVGIIIAVVVILFVLIGLVALAK